MWTAFKTHNEIVEWKKVFSKSYNYILYPVDNYYLFTSELSYSHTLPFTSVILYLCYSYV